MGTPPATEATAADETAIAAQLHAYAHGVDVRDFELVRSVFTADARLDYRTVGGPVGPRDEVVDWLAAALAPVTLTQHLLSNLRLEVAAGEARSTALLLNPFVVADADGVAADGASATVLLFGGSYHDAWRRDGDTWRIHQRRHEVTWRAGPLPGGWVAAPPATPTVGAAHGGARAGQAPT